jgi:sortase A
MSLRDRRYRVSYDQNGNIILESNESVLPEGEWVTVKPEQTETLWNVTKEQSSPSTPPNISWDSINDEDAIDANLVIQTRSNPLQNKVSTLTVLTHNAVLETIHQYADTMRGALSLLPELETSTVSSFQKLLRFLKEPIWISSGKKNVKQYSRSSLFILDSFRFGITFASIFVGLFVALNYQSFWQIASAQMEHLLRGPTIESTHSFLSPTLLASASGNDTGMGYVPAVGPPENRLIIAKLDINIPLVTPSYEALLRQDWATVEKDIQAALEQGAVHYPGTARPGQAGNFFVTAHSSYYPWAKGDYKTVFARLHELEPGDEYWVYYGGDHHRYIVRSKKEVSPSDVSVLDQPTGSRIATLMTCTPVGTTLRRLIVKAEEVDPLTGEPLKVGERATEELPTTPPLEALPI